MLVKPRTDSHLAAAPQVPKRSPFRYKRGSANPGRQTHSVEPFAAEEANVTLNIDLGGSRLTQFHEQQSND